MLLGLTRWRRRSILGSRCAVSSRISSIVGAGPSTTVRAPIAIDGPVTSASSQKLSALARRSGSLLMLSASDAVLTPAVSRYG
jgi:hypothetical protein